MKKISLIIAALVLTSCTMTGKYTSTSQNFDFSGSIIIPVENCKK